MVNDLIQVHTVLFSKEMKKNFIEFFDNGELIIKNDNSTFDLNVNESKELFVAMQKYFNKKGMNIDMKV